MGSVLSRFATIAGLAALLAMPDVAANSTWQIDPAHSAAQFSVRHMAISTVRGAFTKISGAMQLDEKDISKSSVEVSIDVASVDTRVAGRDNDLRSDHFFNAAKYPTITFKSKKV
jgi:polyisoprenoid-binding protein YceI